MQNDLLIPFFLSQNVQLNRSNSVLYVSFSFEKHLKGT
ncbi:MAG: hypothetical protein RL757_3211 [Bacteroidota bacterium]|jgi:hypothetical protein